MCKIYTKKIYKSVVVHLHFSMFSRFFTVVIFSKSILANTTNYFLMSFYY